MNPGDTEQYKVWADDFAIYGPVDEATLAEWIKDARVIPGTFVESQSDQRWHRAGALPNLRNLFPPSAEVSTSAADRPEQAAAQELRGFPIFTNLCDAGLAQLAALGRFYDVAPGTLIVRKGDDCDAVYFVLSGELRVRLLVGVVDKQDKTLCTLTGGEFFGELGMFLQSQRTADVIADAPSRLFRISTSAFQLMVKEIPELASPVLFDLGLTMAKRIADDNRRFYREVTSQFLWA